MAAICRSAGPLSAQIRSGELQRSRLHRERQDLAAGEGRYREHPVSHALWELRQAEINLARIERNLTRSGTSRADRRRWRAELADWQPKLAAAARAVAGLSGPEIARIDGEERLTGERLSGMWGQRETHQRWVSELPEAALRLDHLTGEIDSLNRSLGDDLRRPDRARSLDDRLARVVSTSYERNLGIDLGL